MNQLLLSEQFSHCRQNTKQTYLYQLKDTVSRDFFHKSILHKLVRRSLYTFLTCRIPPRIHLPNPKKLKKIINERIKLVHKWKFQNAIFTNFFVVQIKFGHILVKQSYSDRFVPMLQGISSARSDKIRKRHEQSHASSRGRCFGNFFRNPPVNENYLNSFYDLFGHKLT